MAGEQTERQTDNERREAEQLSLQATVPPSQIPGYRLERFLGAGAFGQVWVGHDLNTGRTVAVKFYLHRGGVNWSLLSHEVKNLVQLSADRHVVQVLEVGWEGDPPYYVMEYLGSGSLEDLLQSQGRLSVRRSVDIFRRICVGLNHSHGKGVLHCDLKPANILLDQDHEPRLADFGQSRMSNDQKPALGTLFYMAPEQADLEAVPDARWDVYGLGAILYRMLTGNAPHRSNSLLKEMDTAGSLPIRLERYRTTIQASRSPQKHMDRRGVDRALGQIVDRCLDPDPESRFANVQQVLEALDRRDAQRSSRPLMLLGIILPLLLITATSIYAARSMSQSRKRFTTALRAASHDSNQFAAKFAASTLENQISGYFDLAHNEAHDPALLKSLRPLLTSPEFTAMREAVVNGEANEVRDAFLDLPERLAIDRLLEDRVQLHARRNQVNDQAPHLATIFLVDEWGTIFAMGYESPVDRDHQSTARNFAFRSYFHGGREDLPRDTPASEVQPLERTHLSAPFKSTSTNVWKIAVSTPVYLSPEDKRPAAVLVLTTNLGEFQLMQSDGDINQLAVLVDARAGERFGTILQHPLMDRRIDAGKPLGAERFQLPAPLLEQMLTGADIDYQDPMAATPDGGDFSGTWLAAVQEVSVPRSESDPNHSHPSNDHFSDISAEPDQTDLLVMVQYRLSNVEAPVQALLQKLLKEGAIAIVSIISVTFILWYLVHRASDLSIDRRDAKDASRESGSTITAES
ncbi:Serine/threonine-protein kinase PknB [Roseimaritima multifibrata]|uniref:Serine/threonine-protein kinase PknB n=1 Tax=Roseimaritima multifibrata TaxID=1930274 RepID=A0A517MNX4_9BACT|nr:protein kinase [Roseimaritima multifibrata]QDS96580.1 Serine/threonine-protein kinase PknB [Roseimaritima multifibrata]